MQLPASDYSTWQQHRVAQRLREHRYALGLRNNLFTIVIFDAGGLREGPWLDATLSSLLQQTYRNIEVLVVGYLTSDIDYAGDFISYRGLFFEPALSHLDILRGSNANKLWRGSHVMFAGAGTTFDADTFSMLNAALNEGPDATGPDLVLCDYDRSTGSGTYFQPALTPGWDPDFIQTVDYIQTAFLISRRLIQRHRAEAGSCGSLHDWLCLVAQAGKSLLTGHLTETVAHLPQTKASAIVTTPAKYARPSRSEDLAIVIPNRNRPELLEKCLGFLEFHNHFSTELVIVDNASDDPRIFSMYAQLRERHGAIIVSMNQKFNFSRMINMGVKACQAPTILFLNNDVYITSPGILEQILAHALRPEVGVVGTKLLYGDGTVQHAGMLLREGEVGTQELLAQHVMRGARRTDAGYLNALFSIRNYQAVTGALMASRREVFLSVGGLDEVHLPVEYNDVDYCLRVREAGYRVISLPLDGVFHLESSSRGTETLPEVAIMRQQAIAVVSERWREKFRHDPYDNPWVDLGDVAKAQFPWSAGKRML